MVKFVQQSSFRQREIVRNFVALLDAHLADIRTGKTDIMYEISDLADRLNIHPRHLSNTVYQVTGHSPCAIFEEKLLEISKELLLTRPDSIAQIARGLTFDPSNFTKFFKRFAGVTPKQFRESAFASDHDATSRSGNPG